MGVGGHHCDPVDVHDEMTEVASVLSLTIIQRLSMSSVRGISADWAGLSLTLAML